MRVADYIIKYIEKELKVDKIFGIVGGGSMFINDAIRKNENIEFISTLHEQSAGIAADAYSQYTGKPGVVCVTTGPGVSNIITSMSASYYDSTPVLYIAGQVKTDHLRDNHYLVRQYGMQEISAKQLTYPITKLSLTLDTIEDIQYIIDLACNTMLSGRPGPVFIEIPLDIQNSEIEVEDDYFSNGFEKVDGKYDSVILYSQIKRIKELLEISERPVILAGNGIKLAKCQNQFKQIVENICCPVLTTWKGIDLLDENDKYFFGRPGSIASRYANFIQQNADLIICLGVRLDLAQIGFNHNNFAKNAKKVIVDIDDRELQKYNADLKIQSDLKIFFEEFEFQNINNQYSEWLSWCNSFKEKYPIVLHEFKEETKFVNTYHLIDTLSDLATEDDIIIPASSGSASEITQQAWKVKLGQKIICNPNLGSMGFSIPHAIGACIASGNKRTICILGDGDLQHNIQELQLIKKLNLNVRLFILNNDGYASIRNTCNKFFDGEKLACDTESGLSLPDLKSISDAYSIVYYNLKTHKDFNLYLEKILRDEEPVICEVMVDPNLQTQPRISNYTDEEGKIVSAPMEDLFPFLDRDEFNEVMNNFTDEEGKIVSAPMEDLFPFLDRDEFNEVMNNFTNK